VVFRGFDRTEVVSALAKLASENDEARREIDRLGGEIERLQASVATQMDSERHVQRALIAASKLADEIRDRAELEARRVLRDAEHRGEQLVQDVRNQAHELEGQIETLLGRRREAELAVESLIRILNDELDRQHQIDASDSGDSKGAFATSA